MSCKNCKCNSPLNELKVNRGGNGGNGVETTTGPLGQIIAPAAKLIDTQNYLEMQLNELKAIRELLEADWWRNRNK